MVFAFRNFVHELVRHADLPVEFATFFLGARYALAIALRQTALPKGLGEFV